MILAAIAATAAPADSPARVRAALVNAGQRQPAAGFALEDSSGRKAALAAYRGKVVLLNFWATWCGGCKEEIPWFQEFEESYRRRGLSVLGVSVDEEGWNAVRPYLKASRVTYRMLLSDRATETAYAVKAMPSTFLIDRKGRVAAAYIGVVERSDIERNLEALLREH